MQLQLKMMKKLNCKQCAHVETACERILSLFVFGMAAVVEQIAFSIIKLTQRILIAGMKPLSGYKYTFKLCSFVRLYIPFE